MPVTPRRGRNYSKNYLNSNDHDHLASTREAIDPTSTPSTRSVFKRTRPLKLSLSQVRHVVHAQGLCLPPPAQAAEEGPRAQNQ